MATTIGIKSNNTESLYATNPLINKQEVESLFDKILFQKITDENVVEFILVCWIKQPVEKLKFLTYIEGNLKNNTLKINDLNQQLGEIKNCLGPCLQQLQNLGNDINGLAQKLEEFIYHVMVTCGGIQCSIRVSKITKEVKKTAVEVKKTAVEVEKTAIAVEHMRNESKALQAQNNEQRREAEDFAFRSRNELRKEARRIIQLREDIGLQEASLANTEKKWDITKKIIAVSLIAFFVCVIITIVIVLYH